jgi:hypothetical protein
MGVDDETQNGHVYSGSDREDLFERDARDVLGKNGLSSDVNDWPK